MPKPKLQLATGPIQIERKLQQLAEREESAGGTGAVAPETRNVATSQRRSGNYKQAYARADGVQTRATTFHLPVELHKALRHVAAENGEKLSDIVVRALNRELV